MHFQNVGDVEHGHAHDFDHGTLVSSGAVLVETLDSETNEPLSQKIVEAPNFVFIEKDKLHRLTALAENTVCACIHALRTNDGELLEPDFFVEQLDGDGKGIIPQTIMQQTGKQWHFPATL
jgi:plasmid replication initiation protein